jgi:predicted ATPase
VLVTEQGEFSVDAASGGLSSIVACAWQIYIFTRSDPIATIVFDEPENHLHPSMQRRFLPSLVEAFPQCQFIVATHSPFVVGSFSDASVYALISEEYGKHVVSRPIDMKGQAPTANQILVDALGLDSTMPIWAEDQLDRIALLFSSKPINDASLVELRRELKKVGLQEFVPDTLSKLSKNR